jgi:hypothetical protein
MTNNLRKTQGSWSESDDRADGQDPAAGLPGAGLRSGAEVPSGAEAPSEGDEVDWAGERKPTDAPWLNFVWAVAASLLVGAGAWILFDRETALWVAPAYTAAMAGGLWFGVRVRRKLAAEAGVPADGLPVLARRIRAERLPRDPRHRRAMAVLARRQLAHTMPMWMYFLAPGIMLLNAVMQAVEGDWWAVALCCAAAGFFVVSGFVVRRNRDHAARVLDRVEGTPDPARGEAAPGPAGLEAPSGPPRGDA